MADVGVMVKAVDFIEAHLRDPIGVAEMAEAVSYSLYYFCRTFHEMTHHTPYDYLMRRRVTEAACDLLQRDDKIIDIAFDYQFNNPETFSRAFRRVMAMSPSQWRGQGHASYRQLMPRLTEAHLLHIQRGAPWRPVVAAQPALCLVGAMMLGHDANATASAWAWLLRELALCDAAPHDFYGLTYCAVGQEDEAPTDFPPSAYIAAVKASSALAKDRALVVKTLPPLDWVHVTHRGPACDLRLTLDYVYHTWMPQRECTPALPLYFEHYGAAPGPCDAEDATWDVYVPVMC